MGISYINIVKLLFMYNRTFKLTTELNKTMVRKIRHENFKSEISENIVRMLLTDIYKTRVEWSSVKSGDLLMDEKRLEVKAFSSNGPSSFGPKENWDWIYFLDCRNHLDFNFKLYEIRLSNNNALWQNLKLNKENTMFDFCQQGKRPRLKFNEIQDQLGAHVKLIWQGYLIDLV